jgi:hypothetical protein
VGRGVPERVHIKQPNYLVQCLSVGRKHR